MSGDTSLDLDDIYQFAIILGKKAGDMLWAAQEARFGSSVQDTRGIEKENAVDLVTQTDIGECNGS